MSGFIRHYLARLKACVTRPVSLIIIVASAAMTFVIWPSTMGITGPKSGLGDLPMVESLILFIYIWLWPALPAVQVKGRATGRRLIDTFSGQGMPTLPIGPKSRVLAEVLVVVTLVTIVRVVGAAFLDVPDFSDFAIGLAMMFPVMIAWATPAKTLEGYQLRPLVIAAAMFAYMTLGLLSTVQLIVVSAVIFSEIALALVSREFYLPGYFERRYRDARFHFRPAIEPMTRLKRDAVALSLSRHGLLLIVMLTVESAMLVLDRMVVLPRGPVYFCTTLTVSFMVFLIGLRPFGSKTIAAGLMGASGAAPGDFLKAWSVLPVKRESVLRLVFANALIATALALAFAFLVVGYYGKLKTGAFAIVDENGDPIFRHMFPLIALILVVPSAAVGGAVGRGKAGSLSLIYIFLLAPLTIGLEIALKGIPARDGVIAAVIFALALAVSLPPIRHLLPQR